MVFEYDPLKYSQELLNEFCTYWTEKNDKGNMRFERETYFEISKRLATWNRNNKKFTKVNGSSKEELIAPKYGTPGLKLEDVT